jgi:hypothetical protein
VIVIAQTLVDIVRRHVGEDERGTSTLRKVHADVRTVLNFSDARRKKGDE